MIRACFYYRGGVPVGFCLRGHAGWERRDEDILCAAVSSAAYLTVNTVTDFYNFPRKSGRRRECCPPWINGADGGAPLCWSGFLAHLNQLPNSIPSVFN